MRIEDMRRAGRARFKAALRKGGPRCAAAVRALCSAWREEMGELEMKKMLAGNGAEPALLGLAVSLGELKAAEALLAAGAELDQADSAGRTALAMSAQDGWTVGVEMLVAAGAALEAEEGADSALMAAAGAKKGHGADCMAALIKAGADVERRGRGGRSPMEIAAESGSEDRVRMLWLAGADPDAEDGHGRRLLWVQMSAGRIGMGKLLFELGADPFVPFDGVAPIEWARILREDDLAAAMQAKKDAVDLENEVPCAREAAGPARL